MSAVPEFDLENHKLVNAMVEPKKLKEAEVSLPKKVSSLKEFRFCPKCLFQKYRYHAFCREPKSVLN